MLSSISAIDSTSMYMMIDVTLPTITTFLLCQSSSLSDDSTMLPTTCGKNLEFDILSILFLVKSYLLMTQVVSGKDVERISSSIFFPFYSCSGDLLGSLTLIYFANSFIDVNE